MEEMILTILRNVMHIEFPLQYIENAFFKSFLQL